VLLLEKEKCVEMVGMISDYNGELGGLFLNLIENLNYKKFLKV